MKRNKSNRVGVGWPFKQCPRCDKRYWFRHYACEACSFHFVLNDNYGFRVGQYSISVHFGRNPQKSTVSWKVGLDDPKAIFRWAQVSLGFLIPPTATLEDIEKILLLV